MLVFPTYQKSLTSKGVLDTVTLSKVWYTAQAVTVNSDFTLTLNGCPTVPRPGRRFVLIHFNYRLGGSDGYNAYNTWFKPSGQSGSATFTIGGVTPTYKARGRTTINGVGIYTMRADLNTSGSDSSITFDWDNTGFDTTGLTSFSAGGGYGFTIWVFDYAEEVAESHAENESTGSYTGMTGFNTAPPGTGVGWTASHKAVSGYSTNSSSGTLNWDPSDSSTYTITNDADIGTSEDIETSYSFEQTASPSNLQGDMDVSSGVATNGVAASLSFLRFRPSSTS